MQSFGIWFAAANQQLLGLLGWLNEYLWSPATFMLLLGAGLLFTLWTKFSQWRALTHGVQVLRGRYDHPDHPGAISHFQALAAALSATVGLGNITGVALAIATGGPGALFWIWVTGFLGMSLKMVEVILAMLYRDETDPRQPRGGAMWVLENTLGKRGPFGFLLARLLGGIFCITLVISAITGGNMLQSWSVADVTNIYFGVPQGVSAGLQAVLVALVILGGIRRIGRVAGTLVPLMCLVYLLVTVGVLLHFYQEVPRVLGLVFSAAFTPLAPAGAFLGATAGYAFDVGIKRALFSNEAGQGSAPIAHAAARSNEPVREGVVAGLEPFIDTICVCTLTALVILVTGTWNRPPLGDMAQPVQLVRQADGSVVIQASTVVADLPSQRDTGEPWKAGMKIYLIVHCCPLADWQAAQTNPESIPWQPQTWNGTIVADAAGQSLSIDWHGWKEPGAYAIQWPMDEHGEPVKGIYRRLEGAALTGLSLDRVLPGLGKWVITIACWLFALSTIISWGYYGEQGAHYLFGRWGVIPYKVIYILAAFAAPFMIKTEDDLATMIDLGTGLMLWANLPIVLVLSYLAVRALDDYFQRLDRGELPPVPRVADSANPPDQG